MMYGARESTKESRQEIGNWKCKELAIPKRK